MTITSGPSTYCNLKCKYCGKDTPLLVSTNGVDWTQRLDVLAFEAFLADHATCALKETTRVDKQPFLLSWG